MSKLLKMYTLTDRKEINVYFSIISYFLWQTYVVQRWTIH